MSQREEMQLLIALKRALEKDMGIEVDVTRYGVKQRLLRLAKASEDPAVAALATSLEGEPALKAGDPAAAGRRIKGYYRGRPIYAD
ncbi:hypothetical protein [Guyparkeria sp.]|uniref:hypothetical protein n=1 Tax=Guyparkeria sp. TaxID=2035736 RepID=UPI00356408B3